MISARRPASAAFRLRLAIGLLASAAVILMGVWVFMFSQLLAADREMAARVREDAMWAVFQADRHAASLLHSTREALVSADPGYHKDILSAYDVLYSRAILLERGAFVIDLKGTSEIGRLSAARTAEVTSLAPSIDALKPDDPDYLSDLAALLPQIAALREGMAQLLLETNHQMSLARVAERSARQSIHDRLGWSAALLVLAFMGIAGILVIQLRQLRRAHGRMALLQRRSLQQASRAKAANAAKSTFLATMSHEIRTPLNAIIGSAELLGSAGLDDQQAKRVRTIQSSGQLLLDVINDILDFSKLDSKTFEQQKEIIDLPDIGETILLTFVGRAEAAGLGLHVSLPALRLRTDPGRLRQVMVNLVGNALKFTPAGEVRLIGALTPEDRLRIEVIDTGVGIREEDIPRLFRDFEQVDGSYARAYGGTGLGLAICKRIVQGLGGEIGVISKSGVGSTFWFEIPVDVAVTLSSTPAVAASADCPRSSQGLRVLVVDDNPINRAVISDQLEQLGHLSIAVENGFVALSRLEGAAFDLVLMDMQMPGISGPDTTIRLRELGCKLPVIGVTANASIRDRKICEEAGMDGFLAKPVTLSRLSDAIQAVSAVTPEDVRDEPTKDDPGPVADPPVPEWAPNPQLEDLMQSLGRKRVAALVRQFEDSLQDASDDLTRACTALDVAQTDAALHNFKGAALTLGLIRAGERAQALRPPAICRVSDVPDLIALAREDVRLAEAWLAGADLGT
ncbi:hybrid sensor histidine kinase/response regulator [Gemmobacter denitrificans]|uniref:histidine kinase n=1 Tax=Gemmobacter denitrificans TaxID=3123040 RepID=A0ABU8BUB4_9RHOB